MPASAEAKRRARRIPAENRKRGIQSCDLCRKKRCKCIAAPGMTGRCITCLHQNLACTYTLPRKTRFYGNVEDLSDRYRCLEALVRGAFPDAPVGTTAELMQLGHSMGYQMPDLSQPGERDEKGDDEPLIKRDDSMQLDDGPANMPPSSSRPGTKPPVGFGTSADSAEDGDRLNPGAPRFGTGRMDRTSISSNGRPSSGFDSALPHRQPQAQRSAGGTTTPPSLVRDQVGREHYIGPSGGLQYLNRLRRVLINHEQRVRTIARTKESDAEEEEPVGVGGTPGRSNHFTEDDGGLTLEVEAPQESVETLAAQAPQEIQEEGDDEDVRTETGPASLLVRRPSSLAESSAETVSGPRPQSEAGLTPGSATTTTTKTTTAMTSDGATPDMSSVSADGGKLPFTGMEAWWMRFPAQEVVEKHLDSYFQNVHDDFPLFHRGTFEDEYETHFKYRQRRRAAQRQQPTQQPPGRHQNRNNESGTDDTIDLGWIACLHMMLAFGSTASSQNTSSSNTLFTRHHVATARSLLPTLVSKCTLSNLRALLLLALWLHNNNERNAAWNLVGVAARIAFALGMHRPADTAGAFRPIEREVRKRVFCTLYALEQFLAGSLDRPSGLADADVQVVPPREALLDGSGGGLGAGGGFDAAGLAGRMLELHRILGKSRVVVGGWSCGGPDREKGVFGGLEQEHAAEGVMAELREWARESRAQHWFNIPAVKTGLALLDEEEDSADNEMAVDDGDAERKPGGYGSSARPRPPRAMSFDGLRTMLSWQSRSRLRATLLLRMQYHYISITVTRPFLLRDLSSSANPKVNEPAGASPAAFEDRPRQGRRSLGDACLWHAGQLALTGLLLDEFGLVNGVSALDIFYLYWACMILSLGMLHRASSSPLTSTSANTDSLGEEKGVVETFANLVIRLREVADKVEKGVTMRRFVTLMGGFADYASHRCLPARTKANRRIQGNPNSAATASHPVGQDKNDAIVSVSCQMDKVSGGDYTAASAFAGDDGGGGTGGFQPQQMMLSDQHHNGAQQQHQAALDSAYWSQAMLPLGTTIEGGNPNRLDSYSWMTGMNGMGFNMALNMDGSQFDVDGGSGNEWMGFLMGGGDMDISMMGDDNFAQPDGQPFSSTRPWG